MKDRLLLIEDENTLARNIAMFMEREGFEVRIASSGEAGLDVLGEFQPQVVLLDYNLPGMDGLEVLAHLTRLQPQPRVIMMTGSGSEEVAVAALKGGAADYLKKPLELAALRLVIARVLQRRRQEDPWPTPRNMRFPSAMDNLERRRSSDARLNQQTTWQGHLVAAPDRAERAERAERKVAAQSPGPAYALALVGESAPMVRLRSLIGKVIAAEMQRTGAEPPAVLITGETGTGKELVATALHREGNRKEGPFVELNCAGIPASLLEAELFGHERGAFTDARQPKPGLIEAASGGTLFLDEIGDLDLSSQAKLLKVLEERRVRRLGSLDEHKVDLRILAATSRDLEQMVRDRQFRADLYYRLRAIRINVPPLREREGDVALLARHFSQVFGRRYGKPGICLASESLALLSRHPWAGNVRELKNAIEQAVVLLEGEVIMPEDLSLPDLDVFRPGTSELHAFHPAPMPGPASLAAPATGQHPVESGPAIHVPEGMTLAEVERNLLIAALKEADSNVSKAARTLGISRDTLRYRARKYQIAC